jgi:hypothetical protein
MSDREHVRDALPADLRARVLAEVARTPSPTRRGRRRFLFLLGLAVVVATLLPFVGLGGIVRGTRPTDLIAFDAGVGLLVAVAATGLALRSGSMLGPSSRVLAVVSSVTVPVLFLVVALTAAWWPGPVANTVHHSDALCALVTAAQGVLPLGAFIVARRQTDPVHPSLTGFALGIAAGAWTALVAVFRCPDAAVAHGVIAHVGPVWLLALAGALLGRALVAIR